MVIPTWRKEFFKWHKNFHKESHALIENKHRQGYAVNGREDNNEIYEKRPHPRNTSTSKQYNVASNNIISSDITSGSRTNVNRNTTEA